MCTLRNFPHLPEHCIEWARDLFELLFVKLGKSFEKFAVDVEGFLEEKTESTDLGQALLELRTLQAFVRALAKPSFESAAQVAFCMYHFLFRDKIQDLISAFPEDARMLDPDTKQDKGPFWSGHRRFPRVKEFDFSDKNSVEFMIASTNLFAAAIGAQPAKKDGDNEYAKGQRSVEWLKQVLSKVESPTYISGGVKLEDNNNASGGESAPGQDKARLAMAEIVEDLKAQMNVGIGGEKARKIRPVEAEFEKDDDLNFHIAVITAAANLRADNYTLPNADFQKVKLVAGRIIPAIATTTACVTGLVMLEMFKVLLGRPCEDLRPRLIGLGSNAFTSFEADPPKALKSGETVIKPQADTLPANAFDGAGKIKDEFIVREPYAAYPDPHTVWDKIEVTPGADISLREFKDFFEEKHKLALLNWDFVLGERVITDNGETKKIPVSATVFPPPKVVDPAFLPALDLKMGEANMAIQKNTSIAGGEKQTYLMAWNTAKQRGELPKVSAEDLKNRITLDTSLRKILDILAARAEVQLKQGKIDSKVGARITKASLEGRKFWLIKADETPGFETIPADTDPDAEPVDVKFVAAIKIPL